MNTDVSLTLADGEHLIVRGPSGSGKSTLIALIAGLNTPERGSITIGASNLADLDLAWWRSRIGFVPQRPHLFSGSLRDNVLLGTKAGDTEIARLLESLGLTRLMARGLDTHLGEAAVGVSGGELQRIALARVLLSPRQWLLLDEPVAHLDPSHVDLVRTALTSRLDRLGVIEVAHGATLLDTTTPTLTMETLEATP
jgi:ABC-type branched-subunit amino acid transport system ATPase component